MAPILSEISSSVSVSLRTDISVPQLLQDNYSGTSPDKVIYEDTLTGKTFTYSEFRHAVRSLAAGLRKEGFKAGDTACVVGPNCVQYPLIVHAVSWIGGIISPIDANSSVTELVYGLDLVQPRLIAVGPDSVANIQKAVNRTKLPRDSVKTFSFVSRVENLPLIPDDLSQPEHAEDEVCFSLSGKDAHTYCAAIMLSSGTTGSPKAVMLSHRNLVASAQQLRGHNPDNWNGSMREVFFPPLSHAYGLYVCMTLCPWLGYYVMLMPRFDLNAYLELLQSRKATLSRLVPTIAKLLVDSPDVKKYSFPNLQYFSCAAAPLTPAVAKRLQEVFPRGALCQTYGATEVTGAITQSGVRDSGNPLTSVGSLIANTSMRLVNDDGAIVPRGTRGEVLIKGPTAMMGYKDNPKATSESFTDGWYRTGDIGILDKEGHLHIVDRIKELIKYNGFQISPSELESILMHHPSVKEACVVGRWSEEISTELPTAFVTLAAPAEGSAQLQQEIAAFVAERVAGYKKLRGGIIFLDELPKSSNGKLLKRSLKERLTATEGKKLAAKL